VSLRVIHQKKQSNRGKNMNGATNDNLSIIYQSNIYGLRVQPKYENVGLRFANPTYLTAVQFFGTEQFESYRKLGEFVGNEMRSKKGKNKRGKNKRG
jgi:hypothetical protein